MIREITAEQISRALGGRRNGRGWRANCVAHDDRDPSLDIDTGEGGKVLLCCRAGCSNEAVIDALKRRGLWGDRRDEPQAPRPQAKRANGAVHEPVPLPPHPQLGTPQHRFDYFGTDGHMVGTICRWDRQSGEKDIRPAVITNGEWTWAGFPKPHPLYRLADIIASPSRPVLVCEGEKTVDAARHIVGDLTLTCWPHGASAVSHTDWTPLRGRDCVLWPDNDEAGAKAMREVGGALREAGARSVRLVKLPDGLPKGWDLADEIPESMDIDKMIAEARDIASERVASLRLITAADLLATEFRPPKCAIPDLVPEGLGLLAGKPKTGKSWLALDFGIAVGAGTCAIGNITCEQGDVLYLALEDTPRRLNGRIRAVLQGAPPPARLQIATEWKRADDGGLDDLRAWLSVHRGARLVVIDTLQKMRGARKRDAGVYEDDYRVIADFKKIADEFTVPIVLVHHLNKEGNSDPLMAVSGTAGITGSADTILVLAREPNDPNAILYVRGRDVNEAEIAIQFDNETGKWLKLGKGQDWRISEERRAIIRTLTEAGPLMPKDIAAAIGKNAGTVRFLLHKMLKDGAISQHQDGRYAA